MNILTLFKSKNKSLICEYITLLTANQIAGISSDFKMDISKYLITSAELEVNLVPIPGPLSLSCSHADSSRSL